MKSFLHKEFRMLFRRLPMHVQEQARQAYRLFLQNPHHPSLRSSLRFKKVFDDPHAAYDKLFSQL